MYIQYLFIFIKYVDLTVFKNKFNKPSIRSDKVYQLTFMALCTRTGAFVINEDFVYKLF